MAAVISLYLDENIEVAIADELRKHTIDVVTVRDLGVLGDTDQNHLTRATQLNRVLCTYDMDFLRLAHSGTQHAGIVFGRRSVHSIGDWVKGLLLICQIYTPADMLNHVEYL